MSDACKKLFEAELRRRGMSFAVDLDSGRHVVMCADGMRALINLENLAREFERSRDPACISRFVDVMCLHPPMEIAWSDAKPKLLLALERNNPKERSALARPISDRLGWLPVLYDLALATLAWVEPWMVRQWAVSDDAVLRRARKNLDKELYKATLLPREFDGLRVGVLDSELLISASLILAPSLRKVVEPTVGWPLLAVMPTRDTLYFWTSDNGRFANFIGQIVREKFESSPYPLSPELFMVSDEGIRPVLEYPAAG